MSWIRWREKMLDRHSAPRWIVKGCFREVFKSVFHRTFLTFWRSLGKFNLVEQCFGNPLLRWLHRAVVLGWLVLVVDNWGEVNYQAEGVLQRLVSLVDAGDSWQGPTVKCKWRATRAVAEPKTWVLEEFWEAIDYDFWSGLKRLQQTFRWEKCSFTSTVYSIKVMLTSSGDIVQQCKEYFRGSS